MNIDENLRLRAEIEELKRDRERLEWMIECGEVWKTICGYAAYVGEHATAEFKTPREAIDAAMKGGN